MAKLLGERKLVVFASSGSGGDPKWTWFHRAALLASARMVNEHLEVTARDRWVLALPAFHVGGFGVLARAWQERIEVDCMDGRWEPARFMKRVERVGATLTSLVPTQVQDLVAEGLPAPKCLRAVVVGGGQLDRAAGQAARELGWPVLQSYGMTEAASQIATDRLDQLDQPFRNAPLPVLPGWEVRCSGVGCLEIQGAPLCGGYLRLREGELQWDDIPSGGWFTTSDRVELSEQGVTMLGRLDRQAKILGELVDVDALERQCCELAAAEVIVVVAPELRRGGRLVPVMGNGNRVESVRLLIQMMNKDLPGFSQLEELQVVAQIPRTPLGKVDRPQLLGCLNLG